MNLEKVIFGFFVLLAATLNFGFFIGDISVVELHNQYELFYAGASFVTKGHAYRTYDWQRASHLVDSMLGSYSLNQELSTPRAA